MPKKMQNLMKGITFPCSLKMEILENNCWLAAGICSSNHPRNGRNLKSCVQKFFSENIPT
jgi:hypothetical protein